MRSAFVACLLLILAVPVPALAEEGAPSGDAARPAEGKPAAGGPPPADGVQWSIGVGVIAAPRPYEGADANIMPVPVFTIRAGAFFFETIRMGVRVANQEHFKAELLAQARFEGHEEDEAKILEGMDERRMSADVGAKLMGKWEHVETDLTLLTDALSRHDGQEVGVGVGFPIKAGGWTITPGLGARWLSDDLADYYYGVELDEAIAGRPAYEVDSTINPRVEVKLRKPFADRKWMFVGQVSHEWLGDEIRDSPIVDASGTLGGYFAFIRVFN